MNRCRFLPALCVAWVAVMCCVLSGSARGELAGEIDAILADPAYARGKVGVQIVRLGTSAADSRVIYRHADELPLIPASNLKILTTSAFLDRLGPEFKFRTQLVLHDHDLILIGDGDPAFGDAELLTRVGWDVDTVFKHWAEQLKTLNVGPIRNVIVDDGIFESQTFHPNWRLEHRLESYEPEVAGLNLNTNCLDFFLRSTRPGEPVNFLTNPFAPFFTIRNQCVTGPGTQSIVRDVDQNNLLLRGKSPAPNDVPLRVTIHDPSMFAGNVLAETLTRGGVPHTGDVRRDRTMRDAMNKAVAAGDKSWQVLGINETPLSLVLSRANKNSVNLYAECMCKRLGADVSGQSGSWQNGTAAVGEFLKKVGVPPVEYHLDDGCGLSRENQVSPSILARVLVFDFFSQNAKTFTDSLAVAGVDGTLMERFRGSPLRGRVLAKSGTLDGVTSLSGYLHARDDRWYVFSILMNKTAGGHPGQEAIVAAIEKNVAAAK